ncbi:hypothetical protein COLO4_01483 [Corchorus olitorius]|uniref:Uncharacterized protein n=1 Tax=Corchorus olitorius TaxID=93759 RepID=A0A1R3L113_9ROSI|nr:hypothetical protein COLO4_02459 [Corchorus olitorius]OMP13529.1 hypothetical protein COLO4_01483 [Corchorus olitorius]
MAQVEDRLYAVGTGALSPFIENTSARTSSRDTPVNKVESSSFVRAR